MMNLKFPKTDNTEFADIEKTILPIQHKHHVLNF